MKKHIRHICFYFLLICGFTVSLKAQFYNLPNEFIYNTLTERRMARIDSVPLHSSIQPSIPFFNSNYAFVPDTFRIFKYITEDPFLDKVFFDDLIHIRDRKNKHFEFRVDPLINFESGRAFYDTTKEQKISVNTRGFIASGTIGKDFYFETLFAENQAVFPAYVAQFNNQTKVVPGQGRWKNFKSNGYDYAFSSGFISWQPIRQLNVQLGHGKQKVGNGYRSLLLSDNAFNYPYARITAQFWKNRIQYSNIYAVMMNLSTGGAATPPNTEPLFQKKAAAFQYVSIQATKRIQVGLFQGMIWQAADSMNRQHLQWQYFNPVIYTNLASYGLNNKNNILIGANLQVKLSNSISVYGQFMADDLSNTQSTGNGMGYQLGVHYYDAFKVKNLSLQAEYNDVTESSYNSPLTAYSNQSYSQYGQNLAYTPGYGKEIIFIADYKYHRAFFNIKGNYQHLTTSNYALYNNMLAQVKVGYTINPAYNLNISLAYNYRKQDFLSFPLSNNTTSSFSISLKTALYNTYYDF